MPATDSPKAPPAALRPGSFAAWMACVRPKTLGIAAAPVAVGLSVSAAVSMQFDFLTALATLLLSLLMQAIRNMENDAGYTKKKAERNTRKGLPRATANGWLTVAEVERMIRVLALVVVLDTAYLIWQGGWVMLLISAASVAAAYGYMGGDKPIAYSPFGELVVFIFFGPVAVGGTYWLQTHTLGPEALLTGSALGLIAAAVLAVNNYRDLEHDREVGRKTLAVVLGMHGMERFYAATLTCAYLLTVAAAVANPRLAGALFVAASLPKAFNLACELPKKRGLELNAVLFGTVKLELLFSLLLTVGSLLPLLLSLC